MKTLIIYVSVHHANTKRVAKAIAEVLDTTLLEPEEIDVSTLQDYDLIGLGSGIYYGRFYKRLRNFVKRLPKGHVRALAQRCSESEKVESSASSTLN